MYLITTWFGTFICDNTTIQESLLFPNNEQQLLQRLHTIQQHKILEEEKKIAHNKKLIVFEKRLQSLGTYTTQPPPITIQPETYGFSTDTLKILTQKLAHTNIQENLKGHDQQLIQMVNAVDDLIHILNLLNERYTTWSLFPDSQEKIQPFTTAITTIKTELSRLEEQITNDMNTLAPNITALVGPLIGARLIAKAGSLHHLATLPASTIQILGAEKALFRYKKEGGKPPKHGIIYQHALLNRTPREKRGRIARIMATTLATAAKADAFTKRDLTELLKNRLTQKLEHKKQETTKNK